MSPTAAANWQVLVGGVLFLLTSAYWLRGLVRVGTVLGALALITGAVVRLANGPLALYEGMTWVLYASAVLTLVSAVRRWLGGTDADAHPPRGGTHV